MPDNFRRDLRPGYSISRVIKGHWQLSDDHLRVGSVDRQMAMQDMHAFIEKGFTTFDVADIYTGAEELIGDFLKRRQIKDDVQVHTKYVPDLEKLATVCFEDTQAIIDRSLSRFGLERLDLVQFHWWNYDVPRYVEVAQHLKELQARGKIRNIGVTNFDATHLCEIIDAGVDVVSAQVQYSVLDRRPENGFAAFCAENDISLLCYGALAGGFLSKKYLGASDTFTDLGALENRSLTKYRLIIEEIGGWDHFQDTLQLLDRIAGKYDVSLSEVAIAYTLEQPQVAACIVGAHNASHLERLVLVKRLKLSSTDLDDIRTHIDSLPPVPGDLYEIERTSDRHRGVMKYDLNAEPNRASGCYSLQPPAPRTHP